MRTRDPARRTPWGTIVVGEENGMNGRIIEILDPIGTTNATIPTSGYGDSSDPTHVVARPALGQFAASVSPKFFTQLRQNKLAWVDQNHPNHLWFEIRVVGESFLQQIADAADCFDPGESAASHYKCEQRLPVIARALGIGFLKAFDQ